MAYTTSDGVELPEWLQGLVSPLDDKLGVVIHELSAERCVVSAPLHGNTQPTGLWHGGASGVLVETAGSLAAMCHARQHGMGAVGAELNVSHLRSPRGDRMTAVATAVHLGRRTTTHSVEIHDDHRRLCAMGRVTCQVIAVDASAQH